MGNPVSVQAFLQQQTRGGVGVRSDGNTVWASDLAREMRTIATAAADGSDRSTQVHVGPSELGHPCDRQVAAKLAGLPQRVDPMSDPWASIVGTSVHAWLAEAFTHADPERWLCENRVTPIEGHAGTADLYDVHSRMVIDHKILGDASHAKIVKNGPSRTYMVQLLLYAQGYRALGYPVERVALAAWPRTKSSMAGLYVWGRELDDETDLMTAEVLYRELPKRKEYARLLKSGEISLEDIPADMGDCFFCPYRNKGRGDKAGLCNDAPQR